MEAILNSILAGSNFNVYRYISLACVILAVLSALFIVIVVMIQPGNSSGISALGGSSDTFFEKNKGKTIESKLRKLTVVCLCITVVLMIAFYLIEVLLNVGA